MRSVCSVACPACACTPPLHAHVHVQVHVHVHVSRPHLLEAKRLIAAHLASIPGEMMQPNPSRPKQSAPAACSLQPWRPPAALESRLLAPGCPSRIERRALAA
jgi:hypothetical protein